MRRNPGGSVSSPGASREAALLPARFGSLDLLLLATPGGATPGLGDGRRIRPAGGAVKCAAARPPPGLQVLWAGAGNGARIAPAAEAAARTQPRAECWPGPCARTGGRGNPKAAQARSRSRSSAGSGSKPGAGSAGTHRRAGRRSAPPARPRQGRAAPASGLTPKGSLRDASVGCPEKSQVGPLPWLSKSRRRGVPAKSKISWGPLAGFWSAIRTPGSLTIVCWATRTYARPFGSKAILRRGRINKSSTGVPATQSREAPYAHPFGSQPILPGGFLGRHHLDVQLLQQLWVDRARRAEHEVLVALRLRKRDHVADVVGPAHRHHQPVDARCDAPMRRDSVLECIEQVPELRIDLFAAHTENLEDSLL